MTNSTDIFSFSQKKLQDKVQDTVNARDLHVRLEIKKDFSSWIKNYLEDFQENRDYLTFTQKVVCKNGVRGASIKIEYFLTIDTAKNIAMMQRTPQGKKIREYFIEIEKQYQNSFNISYNALAQHTDKKTQIENSKKINAKQYSLRKNIWDTINYNKKNCKQVTNKTTGEIKDIGEALGLKSTITNSAKAVCRSVEQLKPYACTMSMNDDIINNNDQVKLEDLKEMDKWAVKVFDEMLKLGIEPAELKKIQD